MTNSMRQSQLFTKTKKEAPTDEVSKNAELLIRGGFIHKEMAGVYSYLPLGLRVLNKIENIIREEMNAIGGQEITMTSLQNPEISTGPAAAKIATLLAGQQLSKKAGPFGTLIDKVNPLNLDDQDAPPPNRPFPWEK